MKKKIFLCAISNISSGICDEDCAFCAQSVKYKANIERYRKKETKEIVNEAKRAKENKAVGFCLVTAGKGLDDKKLEFVCKAAYEVSKEVEGLNLIACNGLADIWQLKELKKHGIASYNHNLETSSNYYKKICSTHSWQQRYQTCLNVKSSGLELCSGGIFGMGESEKERDEFFDSLKELKPTSIPLNFYHPNPSLPLGDEILPVEEALLIIKKAREIFPDTRLMVAGGREITFKERQKDIFLYGADAVVIGNYLTTKGAAVSEDIKMINDLGLQIAQNCNE